VSADVLFIALSFLLLSLSCLSCSLQGSFPSLFQLCSLCRVPLSVSNLSFSFQGNYVSLICTSCLSVFVRGIVDGSLSLVFGVSSPSLSFLSHIGSPSFCLSCMSFSLQGNSFSLFFLSCVSVFVIGIDDGSFFLLFLSSLS
jgi:hypothetical protein